MPKSAPAEVVLTVLAGGGPLPSLLAEGARERGWAVNLVVFAGQPQPHPLPEALVKEFGLAQIGHIVAHLKATGTTHVALAGHVNKPNILSLKPDATGLKILTRALMRHDDALLRSVTTFLEEEGFTLVGVADLAPHVLAPEGLLSKGKPTEADRADMALGRTTLAVLGDLDIGQACIVQGGVVLGLEAAEGTDELIRRCAAYRAPGQRGGWLVKRAKILQTELADLPMVGPQTVNMLIEHGYRGLAIQAGKTLMVQRGECVVRANKHGLLVVADA